MSKVIVLNPFTIDPDAHTLLHGLKCEDVSLAVQADKEQADINYIVKQFGLTLELPYGVDTPVYGDFSDAPNDYHQALSFVKAAEAAFLEMPASIRSHFDNDAGKYLDFVQDDTNYDKAVELGILPPRPAPIVDVNDKQEVAAAGETSAEQA